MREICMSGFSTLTRHWVHELPKHVEVWAMNEAHIYLRRKASRWFQIHPKNWNEAKAVENGWPTDSYGRPPQHLALLQKLDVPVMLQAHDPRIPMSTVYPLEEIRHRYGLDWVEGEKRNYLTSSTAWMLAYAIYQHDLYKEQHPRGKKGLIKTIHLSGIELVLGTEYFHQRACVEFWCGIAIGRGIEIALPKTGASILTGQLYAIEHLDPLHPESMTGLSLEFNNAMAAPFAAVMEDDKGNAVGL